MGDLAGMDLVPEPTIVAAALRACRRLNDFGLTVRILEVVKVKCMYDDKTLWPYMMQVCMFFYLLIDAKFKINTF